MVSQLPRIILKMEVIMPSIHVLDEPTINQIAAGEVVERPSAVIKELIENAMDAGATAVTAEIKEGGLSFIRITDNGSGIVKEDIPLAFYRHATSKIRTAEDLLSVTSLGFRGEALSSIAAVAQVELITKSPSALNGYRYLIEGGEEKAFEEIGCPGGTTIIVRNLFYNTPARRKFLKSAMTEAGYISDLIERLMVSHPQVSFKFIMNNQIKLQSSGNNSSKDIIYHVYGRDIVKELLPVDYSSEQIKLSGFLGKPVITRGNRNYENYFINGRYIKSNVITKAIEEAYKPYMMQHKYPFTSLYFEIDPSLIDVNVHPQKMEIRLKNSEEIYHNTLQAIRGTLTGKEMIPRVSLTAQNGMRPEIKPGLGIPEPFEENRRKQLGLQSNNAAEGSNKASAGSASNRADRFPVNAVSNEIQKAYGNNTWNTSGNTLNKTFDNTLNKASANVLDKASRNALDKAFDNTLNNASDHPEPALSYSDKVNNLKMNYQLNSPAMDKVTESHADYLNNNESDQNRIIPDEMVQDKDLQNQFIQNQKKQNPNDQNNQPCITVNGQMDLFGDQIPDLETQFLSKKALGEHRIIGQVFSTYWLVEYNKELYIIDQHAAHEKVLYERIMTSAKAKTFESQQLLPPIVLTLSLREQEVLRKHEAVLQSLGYEIECFGGNEYSLRAVPADLYGISEKELFMEFIDELTEDDTGNISKPTSILERVASLSCKAAVKANHTFSTEEASALIKELLMLENPYNCPHGRPVIISMSQYELERKFKRVL
jgi:DNA mismatch repair protein MutL